MKFKEIKRIADKVKSGGVLNLDEVEAMHNLVPFYFKRDGRVWKAIKGDDGYFWAYSSCKNGRFIPEHRIASREIARSVMNKIHDEIFNDFSAHFGIPDIPKKEFYSEHLGIPWNDEEMGK